MNPFQMHQPNAALKSLLYVLRSHNPDYKQLYELTISYLILPFSLFDKDGMLFDLIHAFQFILQFLRSHREWW